MSRVRLSQQTRLEANTELLARNIDPDVEAHWDSKIRRRIVPTQVLMRGEVNYAQNESELQKLADFEALVVSRLLQNQWRSDANSELGEIHYFGIGTGQALSQIIEPLNRNGYAVTAYDTCQTGYNYGTLALKHGLLTQNRVQLGDITFACHRRFIGPTRATKLIAARVLDVLDKEEPDWHAKYPGDRKMARTARKIGRLMSYTDVLLIHPYPEDNPNVIWGDSSPHYIGDILLYMEEGYGDKLVSDNLGKVTMHDRVYTAVLISR